MIQHASPRTTARQLARAEAREAATVAPTRGPNREQRRSKPALAEGPFDELRARRIGAGGAPHTAADARRKRIRERRAAVRAQRRNNWPDAA